VSTYDTDMESVFIAGHFPDVPFPSVARPAPTPVIALKRHRLIENDKSEPIHDYAGETIGLLEVLSVVVAKRRGRSYRCRCKGCGIELLKSHFVFENALAKTCGLERCRRILKRQTQQKTEVGHGHG
jgi:hypothetical protein